MSLNVLSSSNAIGLYTYNQINNKKDIILNKSLETVPNNFFEYLRMETEAEDIWNDPETKRRVSQGIRVYNIANVLGYLPIIGTIVGIAKLVGLSYADKGFSKFEKKLSDEIKVNPEMREIGEKLIFPVINDIKSFRKGFIVRAIIETASLGFLLLIPDLIVSIARIRSNEKTHKAISPLV